jgi:hypothetical protein
MAIFEFIEGWYNPHRRHPALDYLSPIDYERAYGAQLHFPCGDEQPLQESAPPPAASGKVGLDPFVCLPNQLLGNHERLCLAHRLLPLYGWSMSKAG